MTIKHTIAISFACAVVAAAAPARAQVEGDTAEVETEAAPTGRGNLPVAGQWGIGAVQTPSGVRGVEGEYYLDRIMVSVVLGFQQYSPAEGETVTAYSAGAGGFYELLTGTDTALLAGGRLVGGHASVADFSSTQVNIELPARLQWHFSKRLAVHFETGLVIAIIPENTEVVGVAPGLGREQGIAVSFGNASLLGNAGLTLYF